MNDINKLPTAKKYVAVWYVVGLFLGVWLLTSACNGSSS